MTPEQQKQRASTAGLARKAKLPPERRREIASLGGRAKRSSENRATHQGQFQIGDKTLECSVLEDGRRLLTQTAFFEALGRTQRGNLAKDKKSQDYQADGGGQILPPPFLDADNLKPFISEQLRARYCPVKFMTLRGQVALGYEATLLPEVCNVYLQAQDAGLLSGKQANVAHACSILIRALAMTGIVALVDEATGYQYDRAREALQLLLKTYIAEDLLPATRRFPHEFLQGAYRLCGWEYSEGVPIKPHLLGTFLNRTIYDKLPPQVIAEIRKLNPVREATKRRKYRQHQLLSDGTGIAHLDKLLTIAAAMMRVFDTRDTFYAAYDKAVPTPPRIPDALPSDQPLIEGEVAKDQLLV